MEDALAEWVGVTDDEGHAEMIGLGRYVDDVKASLSWSWKGCH